MKNEATDTVQIKFKLNMPQDRPLCSLSIRYPTVKCFILSLLSMGDQKGLSVLQITGINSEKFKTELLANNFKNSREIFSDHSQLHIISLESTDPWILQQIVDLGLGLRYPVLIEKGILHIEILAERKKIDVLLNRFTKKQVEFRLQSIGRTRIKPVLTADQEKILQITLDRGFYQVPRKISLSKLAQKFNISASALSERLRRINAALARNYFKFASVEKK
jgi:predicted DNA binding protein